MAVQTTDLLVTRLTKLNKGTRVRITVDQTIVFITRCGFFTSGLNSFQLLQTVTGDGKNLEEDVSSGEEHGAIVRKLTASQSKKHLALLANELADKSFNQWSSSSSESSCSMEDVKQHMLNGSKSHVDLKGEFYTMR